jgi:formate hydrogenlyase transcriptional activator
MKSELVKAIQKRENEKSFLLEFSNEIAAVKNKQQLLLVIQFYLRRIDFYSNFNIAVFEEDHTAFKSFLLNPDVGLTKLWHHKSLLTHTHRYPDGFFELIFETDGFLFFDIGELIANENVPAYICLLHSVGIRQVITIGLRDQGKYIGGLLFFANEVKVFTDHQLMLVKNIANQVGVTVANMVFKENLIQREKEKETLLTLSHEIAGVKDKEDLLPILRQKFKSNGLYTDLAISMINPDRETITGYLINWENRRHQHPDYVNERNAKHPINDGIISRVLQTQGPVLFDLNEVLKWEKVPGYIRFQYARGIRYVIGLALRNQGKEIGILYVVSSRKKEFTDRQFGMLYGMGQQLGNAIANLRANEAQQREEQQKTFLLSISYDIARVRRKEDLLHVINNRLKSLFSCTHCGIGIVNKETGAVEAFLVDPASVVAREEGFTSLLKDVNLNEDNVLTEALNANGVLIFELEKENKQGRLPVFIKNNLLQGIIEMISVPLRNESGAFGLLCLFSEEKNSFNNQYFNIIEGVGSQISIAVANIMAYEKIKQQLTEIDHYKSLLEEENLYLQQQIKTVSNDGDLIGCEAGLKDVSFLISKVADSDTTVLILGETGTGKELVARALHNSSPRKGKLMIKLNCAALPATLIESELFGHEKGSFTGATERRIGKFELANNGTLFLDEIGELALELQVKLLRALQEKEIERIGGKEVVKTNVRIIAATNRDLFAEVQAGRFRSDLYYRLNVFPITVPALKNRAEDIPVLVSHFINKLSNKLGKKITNIDAESLNKMTAYTWPGNVRELEHVIERSALMAKGHIIKEVFLPDDKMTQVIADEPVLKIKSLDESEREHIKRVLTRCNGKIKGIGGAAQLLGVPPTTLHSKMKKLGISKDDD